MRTVVAFVDDLHLTPLSLARVRKALKQFIAEDVSDRDFFGIATATGKVRLFGQFGRDRSVPSDAVDFIPPGPPEAWPERFTPFLASLIRQDPRDDSAAAKFGAQLLRKEDSTAGGDSGSENSVRGLYSIKAQEVARQVLAESRIRRKAMLDSLDGLCGQLAELPGQRLVLVYTDGFSLRDFEGLPNKQDLRGFLTRASQSGVVVSTLVASGLGSGTGLGAEERFIPAANEVGATFQIDRGGALDLQNGPAALARETGGEIFIDRNDLDGMAETVLAHNDRYYSLDYYTPVPNSVEYRDIVVRVRNHPEYTVRAQGGYVPTRKMATTRTPTTPEGPAGELAAAMLRPMLPTSFPVSLELSSLEPGPDDSTMTVAALVDGNAIGLAEDAGSYPVSLDVATVVLDLTGQVVFASSDHVGGTLSQVDGATAAQNGLRYTERIGGFEPGIYQVRIGFRDPDTGLVGARALWVRVPSPKR